MCDLSDIGFFGGSSHFLGSESRTSSYINTVSKYKVGTTIGIQ